jgi:hypothetical protein
MNTPGAGGRHTKDCPTRILLCHQQLCADTDLSTSIRIPAEAISPKNRAVLGPRVDSAIFVEFLPDLTSIVLAGFAGGIVDCDALTAVAVRGQGHLDVSRKSEFSPEVFGKWVRTAGDDYVGSKLGHIHFLSLS